MAVTIYTTPTCGYCTLAKDYLKGKKVPFSEINVVADLSKADELVRKTGQMGVPVLDIKGKIIVGFNKPAIDKALA